VHGSHDCSPGCTAHLMSEWRHVAATPSQPPLVHLSHAAPRIRARAQVPTCPRAWDVAATAGSYSHPHPFPHTHIHYHACTHTHTHTHAHTHTYTHTYTHTRTRTPSQVRNLSTRSGWQQDMLSVLGGMQGGGTATSVQRALPNIQVGQLGALSVFQLGGQQVAVSIHTRVWQRRPHHLSFLHPSSGPPCPALVPPPHMHSLLLLSACPPTHPPTCPSHPPRSPCPASTACTR